MNTVAMVEQAKAERATLLMLASDANEYRQLAILQADGFDRQLMPNLKHCCVNAAADWLTLQSAYAQSIMRLDAIIRLAEMQQEEGKL